MDMNHIGGYNKVVALAGELVLLRRPHKPCLAKREVDALVSLWKLLPAYDKKKLTILRNYRDREKKGFFKLNKSHRTVPGKEATKR